RAIDRWALAPAKPLPAAPSTSPAAPWKLVTAPSPTTGPSVPAGRIPAARGARGAGGAFTLAAGLWRTIPAARPTTRPAVGPGAAVVPAAREARGAGGPFTLAAALWRSIPAPWPTTRPAVGPGATAGLGPCSAATAVLAAQARAVRSMSHVA